MRNFGLFRLDMDSVTWLIGDISNKKFGQEFLIQESLLRIYWKCFMLETSGKHAIFLDSFPGTEV